jgi:hypothetical protein
MDCMYSDLWKIDFKNVQKVSIPDGNTGHSRYRDQKEIACRLNQDCKYKLFILFSSGQQY